MEIRPRLEHESVNLGIAIDIEKKDGSRNLLVPNIKGAEKMNFAEFFDRLQRHGQKAPATASSTIAGFSGHDHFADQSGHDRHGCLESAPDVGQSVIIATGAIEYPAEYQAMTSAALSQLGISKVMTMTSALTTTASIQGAESGLFLAKIHEFLIGQHNFYDEIFRDLEINYPPLRWAEDYNPSLFGGDHFREQTEKQANVLQLINAYRIRGHLLADIDPLNMTSHHAAELDLENYGSDDLGPRPRIYHRRSARRKNGDACARSLRSCARRTAERSASNIAIFRARKKKSGSASRCASSLSIPQPLSAEIKKQLLQKLIEAEQFEQFLHKKYLGQKRFSLEGTETVIPMLDQLVEGASERGVEEIFMGMAHRGRLNVLSNIVGDAETGDMAERIFTVFEGTSHPSFPADEGDVKYHQGAIGKRKTKNGKEVQIQLVIATRAISNLSIRWSKEWRAPGRTRSRNGEEHPREEVI